MPELDFDPIERAGSLWEKHFGNSTSMRFVTSIMRAQQLILAALDGALKEHDVTFARYEVLVLLKFSKTGSLPLSKIGERLMVHPTSVTNAIDRLERQGLVARIADDTDRRRTLAAITDKGLAVVAAATASLRDIDFAVQGLDPTEQETMYELLRKTRAAAHDFREV